MSLLNSRQPTPCLRERTNDMQLPDFVKEGRVATPAEMLEAWPELRQKLQEMGFEGEAAERWVVEFVGNCG